MIELLVTMVVAGILTLGVSLLIYQIYSTFSQVTNQVTVNNEVEKAANWVSADSQMAQGVVINGNLNSGGSLNITWTDWQNNKYNANYTLDGHELVRKLFVNSTQESAVIVARYVETAYCEFGNVNPGDDDYGMLTFNITSHVEGFRPQSASSEVRVITRVFI
jgi:type II secretory pathway pseudopilin PulG